MTKLRDIFDYGRFQEGLTLSETTAYLMSARSLSMNVVDTEEILNNFYEFIYSKRNLMLPTERPGFKREDVMEFVKFYFVLKDSI